MVEQAVILYDEDCGFCRWTIARLLAWDRHKTLRPVALQDAEAQRLLPGMSEPERMRSWHLVTRDGAVTSAGAAIAPLLRMLPLGRFLAPAPEAFPAATEWLYRWTAEHRDRLGRAIGAKACAIDPKRRQEPRRGE